MHRLLTRNIKTGFTFLSLATAAGLVVFLWNAPQQVDAKDSRIIFHADAVSLEGHPFTGVLISHYENGALYQESHYTLGHLEGLRTEYALNGHVREIARFHDGQRDGLQEGWYIEGPKRFEHHFVAGLLEGLQTDWHMSGQIFRQELFSKGTKTDKKIFFQHGEIFTNYAIREGRTYGLDGGALCMENRVREGENETVQK